MEQPGIDAFRLALKLLGEGMIACGLLAYHKAYRKFDGAGLDD